MNRRKSTLSIEDKRAVDVLLDIGAGAVHGRLAKHSPSISPARVNAASALLELLNALPAIEPPKDLVAMTMRRIDQHTPASHAPRAAGNLKSTPPAMH